MRTAPASDPSKPRIGAPESSTGSSLPSRVTRRAPASSRVDTRSRSALSAGSSIGLRVASSITLNTCQIGLPRASTTGQPVNCSATLLRSRTLPDGSVAITPSLMLPRVVESHSRCPRSSINASLRARSARRTASIVAQLKAASTTILETAKIASVAALSKNWASSALCANHPMTSGRTRMPGSRRRNISPAGDFSTTTAVMPNSGEAARSPSARAKAATRA